jgi:Phage capsid family
MTPKQRRALIDQLAHEARGRGLTLERREVAKKKWVWDVRETRAEEQRLRNQRDELLSRARADDALTDPGVKEKLDRLQTGIDRAHAQADEAGQALLNALLGRPTAEWSTMTTTVATGQRWALYGDFKRGYVIGDRLGMQFEIIPHLFGATNRYPTGQRGAYAIWRNDGRCKVLNALRYGETS